MGGHAVRLAEAQMSALRKRRMVGEPQVAWPGWREPLWSVGLWRHYCGNHHGTAQTGISELVFMEH